MSLELAYETVQTVVFFLRNLCYHKAMLDKMVVDFMLIDVYIVYKTV